MKLYHGDCLEELKKIPDNSVDSIVTDPPYGLSNTKPQQVADVLKAWVTGDPAAVPAKKGGFMGKDWDSFVPPPAVWEECMRVLKPGGHMAVFAGARTQDLMGLSIRLAGFEIRDGLSWIYTSGFPGGSMDLSKSFDRAAGELATESKGFTVAGYGHNDKLLTTAPSRGYIPPEPVTEDAKKWKGWQTLLKPAHEPIVLARKPMVGTLVQNVKRYGTGAMNIDSTRVEDRWPSNIILDDNAAEEFKGQTGEDAETFFHVFRHSKKASKKERPAIEREDGTKIQHPTVKPVALMEWLVTLVTPPNGVVLDPFAGSGTTLQAALNEGFDPIGVEQDVDYIQLINKRLDTTIER